MPQRPVSNTVRLGLFVAVGLGFLLVTLFLLGRQQNLFSRSLPLRAEFRNVSGLLPGNNVRLGGITVGTVKKIDIVSDTTVRVEMNLNRDVQPFVHKNAVAVIGTDGLVGNTIINLTAGPVPAPPVDPGDMLATRQPMGIDAMLGTLNISNKNLVAITHDLRRMTGRLDSSAIWHLLGDKTLPVTVHQSLGNVAVATAQLRTATHDMALLTAGVRQGRGPLGYLLTNKALVGQLGHAGQQVAATSDTLAATLSNLQRRVQTGGGPVQTLLTDTALSRQLRQSMRNVEQSTHKLDQSMDALQHNFLLRGFFRRQAKKTARAAGQ